MSGGAGGGIETGFEFYLDDSQEVQGWFPDLPHLTEGRDCCATFRFGGDTNEFKAALAASASLTKLTDGLYLDTQDGTCCGATEVMARIQRELDSIG